MKEYEVAIPGWMEDAAGIGAMREKGSKISLTDNQYENVKYTGQIKRIAKSTPSTPVLKIETEKPSKPKG